MGRLGIGDEDLVVAYDDVGGAVAARLWWMLRDVGHDRVQVLDGGIQAWIAAGRGLESGTVARPITTMTVGPSLTRQVDRHEVRAKLGSVLLLDARAPERYRGEVEPVDPVAGHIPTARNAPTGDNLDSDGRFLEPEALRARFTALGVDRSDETIVYCGSGVYACHLALAMARAGLPEATLYPGSWSDWGTEGGEVATGDEPGQPG
jgi:thiosulfate/3-mercaptopyruvate sulfurtransferase